MRQKATGFFSDKLATTDPMIAEAINNELARLNDDIELIASENIVSTAVLEAQGSILTNKYAEGYPGKRYYGGCRFVDVAEQLAIDRAKQLFNCQFANVQTHSGSQANQAVFMALIKPGDTILGMALDSGGHLTHGAKPNQSGKWFNVVHYPIKPEDGLIDYDMLEQLAIDNKPKMIIAGASAYSRVIDFAKFRAVADKAGAWLMVDMAHIAGLVATGNHPSPLPHAHAVTSTTHKSLRGPRGGLIVTNDADVAKKVNASVFPGLQGGPLMHVIAAKAVAFGEALRPEFKAYIEQVISNAKTLAATLMEHGFDIVSNGTDNHLMLVDLRSKKLTGKAMEEALGKAAITCNKNSVYNDPEKPMITSGIRLGTPAATSRGFGNDEFRLVGQWISRVGDSINNGDVDRVTTEIRAEVGELTSRFPVYS